MSRTLKTLICQNCGKEFQRKGGREAKYCSRDCFYSSIKGRTLITLICQNCGKEFKREECEVKRGRVKFCSHDCSYASRKGKINLARRRRTIKICPICGEKFETGGRAGKKTKIFCSNECSFKARYRSGIKCKKLNEKDASYIAGFIDGEGSIFIYRRSPKEKSYGIRVTVAQSIKGISILEWLKEITGVGSIITREPEKKHHSKGAQWACNSEAAETLLEQVLPYLKLKVEQANMVLEFQRKLRDPKLKSNRSWQKEYRNQIKELNKRGRK